LLGLNPSNTAAASQAHSDTAPNQNPGPPAAVTPIRIRPPRELKTNERGNASKHPTIVISDASVTQSRNIFDARWMSELTVDTNTSASGVSAYRDESKPTYRFRSASPSFSSSEEAESPCREVDSPTWLVHQSRFPNAGGFGTPLPAPDTPLLGGRLERVLSAETDDGISELVRRLDAWGKDCNEKVQ
jgi:hypothetical protein